MEHREAGWQKVWGPRDNSQRNDWVEGGSGFSFAKQKMIGTGCAEFKDQTL